MENDKLRRQQEIPYGSRVYEGVRVFLEDAWTPRPRKQINVGLPWSLIFPGSVEMNSWTRNILLTGVPSYYSQFGFINVNNLPNNPTKDDVNRSIEQYVEDLEDFYKECVETTHSPREQKTKRRKCKEKMADINNIYSKYFVPGAQIVFVGARAEYTYAYELDEYHEDVIKEGQYPQVETMPPETPVVYVRDMFDSDSSDSDSDSNDSDSESDDFDESDWDPHALECPLAR